VQVKRKKEKNGPVLYVESLREVVFVHPGEGKKIESGRECREWDPREMQCRFSPPCGYGAKLSILVFRKKIKKKGREEKSQRIAIRGKGDKTSPVSTWKGISPWNKATVFSARLTEKKGGRAHRS